MNHDIGEFFQTDTGFSNFPNSGDLWRNIVRMNQKLKRVEALVDQSLTLDSCYRCKLVNDRVGGSQTSAHLEALAMDVKMYRQDISSGVGTLDNERLAKLLSANLQSLDIDQLITYRHGKDQPIYLVHIGFRRLAPARHQVLTYIK